MKPDLNLSLEQITGIPARKGGFKTGLIEKCERLWATPLRDFNDGDIRVMLGQKYEPEILVPMALERLEQTPLLEASYYAGDLLWAVLHQNTQYWQDASEELKRLRSVIEVARSQLKQSQLEDEDFGDFGEVAAQIAEFEARVGF